MRSEKEIRDCLEDRDKLNHAINSLGLVWTTGNRTSWRRALEWVLSKKEVKKL